MSVRPVSSFNGTSTLPRLVSILAVLVLGLAFLIAPGGPAYGSPTVEFSLSAPQVVTSSVTDASVKTETFESFEGDLPATGTFAVGTYSTNGASVSLPSSGSTDWGGTGSNYLIVGSGKNLEITLTKPSRYVGFFWGGGDPNNKVEIYGVVGGQETLLDTFLSSDIDALPAVQNGDYLKKCVQTVIDANRCGNANYAYVNLQLSDESADFTKLKFIQGDGGGFEIDNLTTSEAWGNVTKGSQTITWAPTTSLTLADSGLTLSATLTTGNGTLGYEVVSAGTTGCTVSGSTLTFGSTGSGANGCEVRPTATSTSAFNEKTDATTVTFDISPGTFAISSPSSRVDVTSQSFTDVCDASCQVTGFAPADQILVVVNNPEGTALSGRVRLGSATGLTESQPGYQPDATAALGHPELAFVGTQAQVNAALLTLQYKAPAAGGDESIGISATLSGAAYFAGTGNYYEFVSGSFTWTEAKAAAALRSFNGLTGYLATITSAEENAFIVEKTGGAAAWVGGSDEFTQINSVAGTNFDDQDAAEGQWYWITGPEAGTKFWDHNLRDTEPRISDGGPGFLYQNWNNSFNDPDWGSEPNNAHSGEHFLQLRVGGDGNWNDLRETEKIAYVVEFGGLHEETVFKEAFASFVVGAPTAPSQVTGLTATAGNGQLVLSWTSPNTGGSPITDYVIEQFDASTSTWNVLADGESTATTFTVTGLTNQTTYSFRVSAVNLVGTGEVSATVTGTPVAPPPPPAPPTQPRPQTPDQTVAQAPVTTPPASLPPGRTAPPAPGSSPAPLAGPLPSIGGNGAGAPSAPTALIGGRLSPVNTTVVNPNQATLQTGSTSFGFGIPQGQGSITSQGGNTELSVQSGSQTRLSGSGLFPGSTVQVFMPLGANGSREIAQLPVGPSGSFDGDAVFTTRPTDPPLPIGRNTLQIASLNDAGERVIVEMAINIAQPPPAPQALREDGTIPGMQPGQSLATRAGVPVDVSLSVNSDTGQTLIEGDGWTFSVNLGDDSSSVEETPDGGALLSVVRGGTATISGNGFMPLSRADVWLFSDPTLLGTIEIDENGEFNGEVSIDGRVIPVGDHTLQLQGVGVDGFILAANLGVMVTDPDDSAVAATSEASATFLWWVVALIALLVVVGLVWWAVSRRRAVV